MFLFNMLCWFVTDAAQRKRMEEAKELVKKRKIMSSELKLKLDEDAKKKEGFDRIFVWSDTKVDVYPEAFLEALFDHDNLIWHNNSLRMSWHWFVKMISCNQWKKEALGPNNKLIAYPQWLM